MRLYRRTCGVHEESFLLLSVPVGSKTCGLQARFLLSRHDRRFPPAFEDQGPAQVAERRGDDGDYGDGEDGADQAVECRSGQRGEEHPERMYSHRAALYPRHQHVAFQLLGYQEESGDDQGLDKTPFWDEERDRDRGHGPQEGPYDGDDLRRRHPGPHREGVLPDGEEHYRRSNKAHDRAQEDLPPQVPDERPLDRVEKLQALVADRLGNRAEQSAGDLLPLQQQIHGDKHQQQQIEQGPEDSENPTNNARRHVGHLPRRRRVALDQLQDSILIQPIHVLAHVGQVLGPLHQGIRLIHDGLGVADQDLYLPHRRDNDQEQRHNDYQNQDQEHPDHSQSPWYPQPFEAPDEGIQGVGQDTGGQEGQQHAADLAHKEHQQ